MLVYVSCQYQLTGSLFGLVDLPTLDQIYRYYGGFLDAKSPGPDEEAINAPFEDGSTHDPATFQQW